MSFDWRPESKDRYFRKAEAAVKAAGFDDILQISKEQFAITKSTVKVYFKPIPREGKTRRWWEAKKSIAGMQEQSGGRDEFGRKKKTIFIHRRKRHPQGNGYQRLCIYHHNETRPDTCTGHRPRRWTLSLFDRT